MSLRRRVTAAGLVVVLLALTAFGALTVGRLRGALVERTDEELAALASGLEPFARNQSRRLEEGRRPRSHPVAPRVPSSSTLTGSTLVVAPDGTTARLPPVTDPTGVPGPPDDVVERAGGGAFDLGDGHRALVVGVPEHDTVLFVALSLASVDESADDLVAAQVATGAAVLAVCAGLLLVTVRLGLRPLGAVTAAARRMASGSGRAAEAVEAGPPGTEVGELTAALNALLRRLDRSIEEREEALRRVERLAADAAHELRTPVTAILGYAELYQAGGVKTQERLDEVVSRIHDEADRLRDLLEALVVLDRVQADGGRSGGLGEPVDLAELCARAAADSMAIDAGHEVAVEAGDGVWTAARRDDAFQVVANLLANVRSHTPPGTRTTICVGPGEVPGTVVAEVADDGPGIAVSDRPHVFDRFYRAGAARRRGTDGLTTGAGSGLGLAIVRALAESVGGGAELVEAPGRGTTVRVTFPAAVGPSVPPATTSGGRT